MPCIIQYQKSKLSPGTHCKCSLFFYEIQDCYFIILPSVNRLFGQRPRNDFHHYCSQLETKYTLGNCFPIVCVWALREATNIVIVGSIHKLRWQAKGRRVIVNIATMLMFPMGFIGAKTTQNLFNVICECPLILQSKRRV